MKITVQKSPHLHWNWEVYAPKKLFGKLIRKGFKTKPEAKSFKADLMRKWQGQRATPLVPEVQLVVARYQDRLTADQIEQSLKATIDELGLTALPFREATLKYLDELDRQVKRKAITKRHRDDVGYALGRLIKLFENPMLREITKEMVEEFVDNQLDLDYSPRYIKNHVAYLSGLLNWAVNEGWLIKNATHGVNLGSYKPPVHILTPDELRLFLKHSTHYTRAKIMLQAFGGVRSAEVGLIKWEHVRLDENQFYCPGKKNVGAERWITMTPPLRAYFEEMLTAPANAPEGWTRTGYIMKSRHTTTISRWMAKLYEKTGGKTIPRNALRHSYGSQHLVGYGNQFGTAAEMGHASPKTTYAFYRAAVTKSQALDYWKVRAKGTSIEEEESALKAA